MTRLSYSPIPIARAISTFYGPAVRLRFQGKNFVPSVLSLFSIAASLPHLNPNIYFYVCVVYIYIRISNACKLETALQILEFHCRNFKARIGVVPSPTTISKYKSYPIQHISLCSHNKTVTAAQIPPHTISMSFSHPFTPCPILIRTIFNLFQL